MENIVSVNGLFSLSELAKFNREITRRGYKILKMQFLGRGMWKLTLDVKK